MNTMRFKRVAATVVSTVAMLASSMPAFAAEDTTTAGSGQILDYKIVKQVVPTAMKVAINPNGYAVNIRYSKLASGAAFVAGTKYYKETSAGSGKYEIDATVTAENFASKKADLYTAETKNNQIISFNYGLANKSTVDRNISVSFAVTADENISFVGTAAEATNEAVADDGGAKKGEYKIFLQVVPAKVGEAITADTYAKATAYAANTKYYTRNASGKYTEDASITSDATFKAATEQLYEETTTIGTEIQPAELADVTMQNSTAPIDFKAGKGSTAADVAYKLPKATYDLKKDAFIEIGEEYADLGSKFEMTAIGGISGFTVTGSMNTNTEWSKLTTNKIVITPTYRFEDSTGLETTVATGLNQIDAKPANVAPSATATQAVLEAGKTAKIAVNLGSGTLAATGVSEFLSVGYGNDWIAAGAAEYADGYITITDVASVDAILGEANADARKFTIKFNDTAATTVNITLTAKE